MSDEELIESILNTDRVIHEPARMAILTVLSSCAAADFMYLQGVTGLNRGNLSLHLSKLESRGIISIEKMFVRKIPRTMVHLTKNGKAALKTYWRLQEKAKRAQSKRPSLRRLLSFDPDPDPSAGRPAS